MRITTIKSLPNYRLELSFDDGTHGVVDLSSFVGKGVFAAWTEPAVFEQAAITEHGAVAWPGEIDLCADSLYLQLTHKRVEELFPTLANRLSHA